MLPAVFLCPTRTSKWFAKSTAANNSDLPFPPLVLSCQNPRAGNPPLQHTTEGAPKCAATPCPTPVLW